MDKNFLPPIVGITIALLIYSIFYWANQKQNDNKVTTDTMIACGIQCQNTFMASRGTPADLSAAESCRTTCNSQSQ